MRTDDDGMGLYIQKVRDNTLQYMQDLLNENGRLRVLAATLENDKQLLQGQLVTLQSELDTHEKEHQRLHEQLRAIEQENRRYSEQYVEVEQQNSKLANLYVAGYRLHGTLDRFEIIEIIQDIVANLIGSEEVAIFELEPGDDHLTLVSSIGIDPSPYQRVLLNRGIIGQVAASGEICVSDPRTREGGVPEEANLTACVPFKLNDRVTGAIAVFRLLPQKPGLEEMDRELFELLATQAAMAFYCTKLHAQSTAPVGAGL